MIASRLALLLLVGCLLAQLGGSCGGGSGGGGRSVRSVESPDPRCAALSSEFPPGFDFVPGREDRVWVVDFSPPTLLPFDVGSTPPRIPNAPAPFVLPFDSDGDGLDEGVFPVPVAPILDDISAVTPDLALVTASSYEEVLFFDPGAGSLRIFDVSVPAAPFVKADNPFLPDPGTAGLRTGLSTLACVRPAADALDSRGDPIAASVPAAGFCDPSTPSYLASFTSGAAIAGGHLFVTTSNLGDDAGTPDAQYLPGSVLVYDLDLATDPPRVGPNPDNPVILPVAFNPTHVTSYAADGREFVLVAGSGAIGIRADDPGTSPIEGGAIALTEASIDVIDASSLQLVGTIPLGLAALAFGGLAVDPTGRVAVIGSAADRLLFAVDLAPLSGLPTEADVPVVLHEAVIFDAASPFRIPALAGGAPAESCPGFVAGAAFNDAGDLIFASDFCDGTLAVILADLSEDPPVPVPASRFDFVRLDSVVAPLRADTLGLPRAPGRVAVRPGRPGVDFSGPDIFFLLGQPGLLCGVSAQSS